jgi:sigma-54 dependent transcriptional regulator, acetoin dehydrogenase operon transcriptional activator AcoR
MALRTSDAERQATTGAALAGLNAGALVDLNPSWQRCKERYHFDRRDRAHVTSLTARETSDQQEPFGEYLAMIRNELEFVHATLQAANSCASFSDMAGIILHCHTDGDAPSSLDIERSGTIWAEGMAGTNGVGTCVIEKRPTMVVGRDHFFTEFASFSCIAAPVLSAEADMIGVLNVATGNPDVTGETLAMIARLAIKTAERLSNQFFLNRFRTDTIVKIGGDGQAILLALNHDQRIIGANRGARSCYGWADGDLSGRDVWSVFERSPNIIDGFTYSGSVTGLRRLDNRAVCDATILRPHGKATVAPEGRGARHSARHSKLAAIARPDSGLSIEQCLGPHPKMVIAARLLRRVSGSSLPVLLLGETGVGKDTLAKILHNESERRDKPFIAFNCAAVPESLIDSELFGYGVGAFTGAKRDGHVGRLKQADGGTLFLDEIGDMPLSLQTRLLRVLESGEVSPLGSAKTEHIDIHFIAATNNDLRKAVAEGRFRQDLYYRLAGVVVELQPLRERSDLEEIAKRLLFANANAPPAKLSPRAIADLSRHSWPGNLRELKFVLHRAQWLCEDGLIEAQDLALPDTITQSKAASTEAAPPVRALRRAEREVIVETLALHRGDVTAAAKALDMSRATLYRKIHQHALGSQKVIN